MLLFNYSNPPGSLPTSVFENPSENICLHFEKQIYFFEAFRQSVLICLKAFRGQKFFDINLSFSLLLWLRPSEKSQKQHLHNKLKNIFFSLSEFHVFPDNVRIFLKILNIDHVRNFWNRPNLKSKRNSNKCVIMKQSCESVLY